MIKLKILSHRISKWYVTRNIAPIVFILCVTLMIIAGVYNVVVK
jgi:hypothetical protein